MATRKRSVPYRPADYLGTPEDIGEYLTAALEDGDERVLLMALRNVAAARGGMTKLARETGLSRESLYRALSDTGNPRLSSLVMVLDALGLKLSIRPKDAA
ncbi:MAG TPA: addiction module antidote protein [Acidiferrobacterales bacterium]